MKRAGKQKLVIYLIALGLTLNGFCMNLLVPKTAMAMSMMAPAGEMSTSSADKADSQELTVSGQELETMPMMATVVHCENINMTAGLNCCLAPINHGSDKSFDVKKPQENSQHVHLSVIKTALPHLCQTGPNNHLQRSQHREKNGPSPGLTGKIVKRE